MIVTVTDVEDYLQRTLPEGLRTFASATMIPVAQDELELRLNRNIEPATFTEERHPWFGSSSLYLKRTPVSAVTSLWITETDAATAPASLVVPSGYQVFSWGVAFYSLLWGTPGDIVVTYTAGIPSTALGYRALKGVVLRRVARETVRILERVIGVKDQIIQVEGFAVAYEAVPYTSDELESVSRFKRRVLA